VTIGNTNVNPGRRTTTSPGSRPKYRDTTGHAIAASTSTIPTAASNARIGEPTPRIITDGGP
jgi:hypothetical protein